MTPAAAISPVALDSEHFALRVGAITVRKAHDVDGLVAARRDYDAVWVTVTALELVPAVCNAGSVGLVDYRYDFTKDDGGRGERFPPNMPLVDDAKAVRHLATNAFATSRFSADPRTHARADTLFERWLTLGAREGRLRAFEDHGLIVGFILAGADADGASRHVLAAVDPAERARGIYSQMITANEKAAPIGATLRGKVPVATLGPIRALPRLGYRVGALEAVIHLWR